MLFQFMPSASLWTETGAKVILMSNATPEHVRHGPFLCDVWHSLEMCWLTVWRHLLSRSFGS